jgi:hypothetical protein
VAGVVTECVKRHSEFGGVLDLNAVQLLRDRDTTDATLLVLNVVDECAASHRDTFRFTIGSVTLFARGFVFRHGCWDGQPDSRAGSRGSLFCECDPMSPASIHSYTRQFVIKLFHRRNKNGRNDIATGAKDD